MTSLLLLVKMQKKQRRCYNQSFGLAKKRKSPFMLLKHGK